MFAKKSINYLNKNIGTALEFLGGGNKLYGAGLAGVGIFAGYHGGKFGMNLRANRRSRRMIDEHFEDIKNNPMKHSFS